MPCSESALLIRSTELDPYERRWRFVILTVRRRVRVPSIGSASGRCAASTLVTSRSLRKLRLSPDHGTANTSTRPLHRAARSTLELRPRNSFDHSGTDVDLHGLGCCRISGSSLCPRLDPDRPFLRSASHASTPAPSEVEPPGAAHGRPRLRCAACRRDECARSAMTAFLCGSSW